MGTTDGNVLSWITFLPLLSALLLLATGMISAYLLGSHGFSASVWRLVGLGTATINFALAAFGLWGSFDPEGSGFQLVERVPWLPTVGINYFVGIDGISLLLVLLTSFMVPVVMLATWKRPARSVRSSVFFMLLLETCLIGSFVSLNLFQFQLLCELALLPMFFMIGVWGGPGRRRAATRFLSLSLIGSLVMFAAIVVVASQNLAQNSLMLGEDATWNLDLILAPGDAGLALLDTAIPVMGAAWWETQTWLFAAFALAFAIKAALFPLHSWLPNIYTEGPGFSSALIGGPAVTLGAYGLIRFALPLFPHAASSDFVASLFMALAVLGICYAALVALVTDDLKGVVAYASVAQLGLATLGVFSLNAHGLTGTVMHLVSQALCISSLTLLTGFLYERRQTRDLSEFGGLARVMPVFAACFGLSAMALIGVPFLAVFVGEFLILLGTFAAHPLSAIAATFGLLLLAGVVLLATRRLLFGPISHDANRGLLDLDRRERTVMVALIVPILWIGVNPNPLLRRVEPAVIEVLEHMRRGGAPLELEEPWSPSLIPVFPGPEPALDDESLLRAGDS